MQSPLPLSRELLLIGGGHSHALVLRMWGMKPLPGVRLSVVNPLPSAAYSGMLPGFVAGHYAREELQIDLVKLARFAGARLIAGRVVHLDVHRRIARLEDGRELPYHLASLDIGITTEMPDIPGFSEHAVPAKPLDGFADRWHGWLEEAGRGGGARAAVIGGGVAGVELALAMAHALKSRGVAGGEVSLIERAEILPDLRPSRRDALRRELAGAGIALHEGRAAVAIGADHVALEGGGRVAADLTVGVGGARPQGWLAETGLYLHEGYVQVDETLRSLSAPDVFAAGDIAHLSHAPRPKAGVFAVRAAPVLFHNLRAALSGGAMRAFRPQSDYLKLISLGGKRAMADKWGLMLKGPALWRLKDRIDRAFMRKFQELKPMPQPLPRLMADGVKEVLGGVPLCGGCGSKVSAGALSDVLSQLPETPRQDVLSGPGDDAAVLRCGRTHQVLSTDHLRAFCSDPALMARITAIHALGDIWAMGASAQAALASITLPRMSEEMQRWWLAEIMQAAGEIFAAEGAAIVGGHSSQGSELSIGFTISGLRTEAPIGKGGARPGDRLLLTKPIGTGVILAAEMRMQARGEDVLAAYRAMQRPQGKAAALLAGRAHAMTDVTGFGLAGHAQEIAEASGLELVIDTAAVPLLPGAEALSAAGVRSTIWASNQARVGALPPDPSPRTDLLFDPQTAGGLLAAVRPDEAEDLCAALAEAGCEAAIIGECREGPPWLRIA